VGDVSCRHFSRTAADALYRAEVEALAAHHRNVRCAFLAREGGGHLSSAVIGAFAGDLDRAHAAVCGPPALLDAVRQILAGIGGEDRVLAESFTPPPLATIGSSAAGTLRFLRTDRQAAIGQGTLLEQAEAAGLSPDFGCRLGICHTCTCRKTAGPVRNLLADQFTEEEAENETRGGWYLRQTLGSANLTGSRLFHILSGNLSHQIEHHLFPDIPAHRSAEIAVEVREICERYGVPYNTGSLYRQFGSVVKKIVRPPGPRFGTSWRFIPGYR
jgi:ferredoxin